MSAASADPETNITQTHDDDHVIVAIAMGAVRRILVEHIASLLFKKKKKKKKKKKNVLYLTQT